MPYQGRLTLQYDFLRCQGLGLCYIAHFRALDLLPKLCHNIVKDNVNTSTGSTEVTNLCDTATQNCIRIVDELTKAQPQYTQSVSNLQLDYVAAAKNTIQNIGSVQKMLSSNVNFP